MARAFQKSPFLIFTIFASLVFSVCCGRASTATLLQVKDKLMLSNKDGIPLTSITLRPFPFIKDVI